MSTTGRSDDSQLYIAPLVRVLGRSDDKKWLGYRIGTLGAVYLTGFHVAALCRVAEGATKSSLTDWLVDLCGSTEVAKLVIDDLLSANLIRTNGSLSHVERALLRLRTQWVSRGWRRTFDYIFHTHDWPFLEQTNGGRKAAAERMREYASKDADTVRTRHSVDVSEGVSIALPQRHLPTIAESIKENGEMPAEHIWAVVRLAFGKVGERATEWRGLPIILRAAPSGGGRNPTDVYVFSVGNPDIEDGCYYLDYARNSAFKISKLTRFDVDNTFPALVSRAPRPPKLIFSFASHVERNMFRYREPRTYRTLYFDAGHLMGNLEIILRYLGIRYIAQYHANIDLFSRITQTSPETDLFVSALSVGGDE